MKTFENKKTTITESNGTETRILGFADLALVGLNAAPKEGWTTDEMRKRFKVIDKLEDVIKAGLGNTVDLEDAEFEILFNTSKVNWAMMHRDLIKFDDYVQELSK